MAANDHQPNEQKPEPLLLVRGKRAGLGALRRDLIPIYQRWRSDPEAMRGLGSTDVATIEAVQGWYDQAASSDAPEVYFTVYDLTDLTPGLHHAAGPDRSPPGHRRVRHPHRRAPQPRARH